MVDSSNEWLRARVALALLAGLGACSVGVGAGQVSGSVNVARCELATDSYQLDPGFYGADDFENQLTIRIQQGGGFALDTDGLSIVVADSSKEQARLGTPIALTSADDAPVHMSFYLNDTCPPARYDTPVFLNAVEGTIVFEAIYAPEVDDTQREIRGSFENVRFVDTVPDPDEEPREALLSGTFSFLFDRGRPAQPFP